MGTNFSERCRRIYKLASGAFCLKFTNGTVRFTTMRARIGRLPLGGLT